MAFCRTETSAKASSVRPVFLLNTRRRVQVPVEGSQFPRSNVQDGNAVEKPRSLGDYLLRPQRGLVPPDFRRRQRQLHAHRRHRQLFGAELGGPVRPGAPGERLVGRRVHLRTLEYRLFLRANVQGGTLNIPRPIRPLFILLATDPDKLDFLFRICDRFAVNCFCRPPAGVEEAVWGVPAETNFIYVLLLYILIA